MKYVSLILMAGLIGCNAQDLGQTMPTQTAGTAATATTSGANTTTSPSPTPSVSVTSTVTCNALATYYGGGTGTASDPYLICSPEQFYFTSVGATTPFHYLLTQDLDMRDLPSVISWPGNASIVHGATIDGGGHTVQFFITISSVWSSIAGTLENITVENVTGWDNYYARQAPAVLTNVLNGSLSSVTFQLSGIGAILTANNFGTITGCTVN